MIATDKILSQEKLSTLNSEFADFIVKDKSRSASLSKYCTEDSKDYSYSFFYPSLQPLPTFMTKDAVSEVEKAVLAITKLLREAPKRLQNYDESKLRMYHQIEEEDFETNYKKTLTEVEKTSGRMDFLLTKDGVKCIEFNIGLFCGCWEDQSILNFYNKNSIFESFCKENNIKLNVKNTLAHFIDFYVSEALNSITDIENDITILIWYDPTFLIDENSFQYKCLKVLKKINKYLYNKVIMKFTDAVEIPVQEYMDAFSKTKIHKNNPKLNLTVTVADEVDKLKLKNEKLYYDRKRVHILLPFWNFPSEKLENKVSKESSIFTHYHSNRLLGNKEYFATLSENESSPVFSKEEQEAIRSFIPWSRKLRKMKTDFKGDSIDLKSFCIENKDLLVLKKTISYGGYDVYIGKDLSQEYWNDIISKAIKTNEYIIQEYVESLQYNYLNDNNQLVPHRLGWGAFVVGDNFAGGFARVEEVSKSSKVNISQGATLSFIFEVEE